MEKRLLVSMIFFLILSSCGKKMESLIQTKSLSPAQELVEKLSFTTYENVLKQALMNDDTRLWSLLEEACHLDPEWLALVDKTHKLNPLWAPKDLINLKDAGIPTYRTDIKLRKPVIQPLLNMINEAKKDEVNLWVVSAYRDITYQQRVWDISVALDGLEYTENYVAVPGTSQHHLGSVVDLNMANEAFNNTPPSHWLAQNAYRFGFSLSYPEGYEEQTGYSPESWHYRYFPGSILEIIQNYFDGLQFAFLNFWFRNGKTIKGHFNVGS